MRIAAFFDRVQKTRWAKNSQFPPRSKNRERAMSRINAQEAKRLVAAQDLSQRSPAGQGDALVAYARETRLSAERFAATVRRFSEEMPANLDRFHDTMQSFRRQAQLLRAARA
jgi:hypothetical protein